MGYSRMTADSWTTYSASTVTKSRDEIFTSSGIDAYLDPSKFDRRESRNSEANPAATPIILAVDVTGSMGKLAEVIVKKGLGTLVQEIYDRKPVTDPHILVMAIGDTNFDHAPIQASQFESDMQITGQIEKIYLEGGGGGNNHESYTAAWLFAKDKTACDAFKDNRKGFIFTIGDECINPSISSSHAKNFLGISSQVNINSQELFKEVSKNWEIYHLMVTGGSYFRSDGDGVRSSWREVIGQRALELTDVEDLAEVIVSILEVGAGKDKEEVIKSWKSEKTQLVVRNSVKALTTDKDPVRF